MSNARVSVAYLLALALAIVACRGPNKRLAPAAPIPTTAKPDPLAGWVSITPDEERFRCASQTLRTWRVGSADGTVRFIEADAHEPNTGPPLPFALPKELQVEARDWVTRHVLAAGDELLVGFDKGEWSGSLHVFSADGTRHHQLAKGNVRGIVAFGDEVVSIEGSTGMMTSEGNLRWLHREGDAWKQVALVPLDSEPETFVMANEVLYIVTMKSLVRVELDRVATVIQPVASGGLHRESMIVDQSGAFWLGMQGFVVRLAPQGGRYDQTWFVPASGPASCGA